MAKFVQLAICGFAQFIALIGVLIGCGFAPQLGQLISSAMNGHPWQVGELARLVACTCGPILFGSFVTLGLIWYVRSSFQLWKRMADFPEQPWLWRADWEDGLIRLSNNAALAFFVVATISYLLIALPLGIYLASLKNARMVYAFLAVLALFLLFFLRMFWVNRTRNRSILQLETLPGVVGGRFSGIATVPLSFPKDTTFHVKLRCELSQRVHTPSGTRSDPISVLTDSQNGSSRSDTQTSTVYEDEKLVTPEDDTLTSQSTAVRVAFEIPANLPSTGTVTEVSVGQYNPAVRTTKFYRWIIHLRLSTENELRDIVFEIPVFNVPQSPMPAWQH
jgi:hypothetical protein